MYLCVWVNSNNTIRTRERERKMLASVATRRLDDVMSLSFYFFMRVVRCTKPTKIRRLILARDANIATHREGVTTRRRRRDESIVHPREAPYARARARASIRLVLDFVERVVVGGDARVVDLFETNDNRVAHTGLIHRDDLAVVVEPVGLRAENLNLRASGETASHEIHRQSRVEYRVLDWIFHESSSNETTAIDWKRRASDDVQSNQINQSSLDGQSIIFHSRV